MLSKIPEAKTPNMNFKISRMVLTLLITLIFILPEGGIATEEEKRGKANSSQCTLYMATTTTISDLGKEVKLSMFAGIDMEAGTTIGMPEIAIPVIDIDIHNGVSNGDTNEDYFDQQKEFFWDFETAHANFDVYPNDRDSSLLLAIPGVGALGNEHFTSFINADFDPENVLNRDPVLDDDTKGFGANSHYYDITLKSTRFIPAGMEILVGNVGAPENEENPLISSDFVEVDEILGKIQAYFDKHGDSMDEDKRKEIYEYLVEDVVGNQFLPTLNQDGREDKDEIMEFIVEELFPEFPDLREMLGNGGAFMHHFPETKKSLEWLEENGQCLDKIYAGKSTIPGAERGAFATRAIKEGELISPAPLLLIPNTKFLNMYTLQFKGTGMDKYVETTENNEVATKQLLLNYCFGHPESSLLFYPYGMGMNMINHKPTGNGSNSKLVWSNASYHDPSVLHKKLIEDEYNAILPLGVDVVATRNIEADEEIFLDYGPEWQQAWDEYIKNQDSNKLNPSDALRANADARARNLPFPTIEEREEANAQIMTMCNVKIAASVEEYDTMNIFWNSDAVEKTNLSGENWKICDLIERSKIEDHDNSFIYTVKVYSLIKDVEGVVKNLPHKYVRYTDKPYSHRSIHGRNAFRHFIGIPNNMFPSSWRDTE